MNRNICGLWEFRRVPVGAKMWFKGEKQGYTVQASNVAFVVLTKPFNARKTVLYCIVDWERNMRGPEDLIFSRGAETREECEEMLERLTLGESEVSQRHHAPLEISKYYNSALNRVYTNI
jgi:hypothetical protein